MQTDGTILLPQYVVSTNPNTYCKATTFLITVCKIRTRRSIALKKKLS